MKSTETKQKILEGALCAFKEKGARFTMDDLAKTLGMSKKTIYKIFKDKSVMLYDLIEYIFDAIKKEEQAIYEDKSLACDEKFIRILSVLPDRFRDIDFAKMYQLKGRYPKHYARVEQRLESGWELTWEILDEGIKEGYFIDVNKGVFKLAYGAALERFLSSNELDDAGISYIEAMQELVKMLVNGIRK